MPLATRTFRIFVSSTFDDLETEREVLHREVFPNLRKLCESYGARFQAVDLRWGVRSEAGLDQKTMDICFAEIERCRRTGLKPNFIALLGDRYGWRPLPTHIDAVEFEQLLACMSDGERELLIWKHDQAIERQGWYRRDDNAVPAQYNLRRRQLSIFKDASVSAWEAARKNEAADWEKTENRVRRILNSAIHRLGWSDGDQRRIKYEASVTHQEILAGLGATVEDRRYLFAFLRNANPITPRDPELEKLQKLLIDRIGEHNICRFEAGDTAALKSIVEQRLRGVIRAELKGLKERSGLDLEIEVHDKFAHEHARGFQGRTKMLAAMQRGGESRPFVLHGPSGSGKTALMAKASDDVRGAVLVRRFVGLTPAASQGTSLLRSVCAQISRDYDTVEKTPSDFQSLVTAFHQRLSYATRERPLVIFLDALDQLSTGDPTRSFTWLAQSLPPFVRIVLSATALPSAFAGAVVLDLEPFQRDDSEALLDAWLVDAGRRLSLEQRNLVLSAVAHTQLPLHLKMAFDEARFWPSFADSAQCLLSDSPRGLVDVMLERLSRNSNHGAVIVSRSLAYLVAARYGLADDEMIDVLSADDEVWQDFLSRARHDPGERRLPAIVWSRLSLDLEPYLSERALPIGAVLCLQHTLVAERMADRFLPTHERSRRHLFLAQYFEKRADPLQNGTFHEAHSRALSEVVYHQACGEDWTALAGILHNFAFLQARCSLELGYPGVYDLLEDLRFVESTWRGPTPPPFALTSAFYSAAPLLASSPRSLYQEMSNNAVLSAMTHVPSSDTMGPWFQLQDVQAVRRLRINAHAPGHVVCRFSTDGFRLWTAAGDHVIRQWDTRTLREVYPPISVHSPVWRLDCHPSEPWLAVIAGIEGTLQVLVFDTNSATLLFRHPNVPAPSEVVLSLGSYGTGNFFSERGGRLSLEPSNRDWSFDGFERFGAIAFHKSGRELLTALGDGNLLRISTTGWIAKQGPTIKSGQISCVAAAVDREPWIGVLCNDAKPVPGHRTLPAASVCTALPNGMPVWGSANGSVWCGDLAGSGGTLTPLMVFNSPVVGCAAMTTDGVAIALEDGTVLRLSIPGGSITRLGKLEQRITSLDYSHGCKLISIGLADGTVELLGPSPAPTGESQNVSRIALSPDGRTIAEIESGRIHIPQRDVHLSESTGDEITVCRFLDSNRVVTGTVSGWLRLWDLTSESVIAEQPFGKMIARIDCAPSIGLVAVISGLGDLDLWSPGGGPLRRLSQQIRGVRFSPDGRWLACTSRRDGFGVLDRDANWAGASWYSTQRVDFVAISPDNAWLLAGNQSGYLLRIDLPFREGASELLLAAPHGSVDAMIVRDHIVLVGDTCQIRCAGKVVGALQIPGLQCFDTAPGAGVIAVKQVGNSPVRYRLNGF